MFNQIGSLMSGVSSIVGSVASVISAATPIATSLLSVIGQVAQGVLGALGQFAGGMASEGAAQGAMDTAMAATGAAAEVDKRFAAMAI